MKLVIGGRAQGKLNYVIKKYGAASGGIYDGAIPEGTGEGKGVTVINHLHDWIRAGILNEGNPEEEILDFLKKNPDCILISDEVGNGIVPADAFEREYRERVGRMLVELAGRADSVERVICGIGQKLK